MRTHLFHVATVLLVAVAVAAPARGVDPLIVARAFCSADGNGGRLSPYEWQRVAPLVTWRLEPAWDRLVLIRGYEISTPRRIGNRVEVEVAFTVVGEVTAGEVERGEADDKERRETVTLSLVSAGDDGWLIDGAPHPPHVFENVVDPGALAELLSPESGYQSSSAFAWQRLVAAGWDIPHTTTTALPASPHFHEVGTAEPGDLALYYAHGSPYHVGLIEADDAVLSATLNAGAIATPFAAFPGAIRYWRPQREIAAAEPDSTRSPAPLRRR